MAIEIGTKQGITYYSECKHMSSITNPTIGNKVNMRYTGFFTEQWDEYDIDFDTFGYGLKKTRANKGLILCDNAARCFNTSKGYVGMILSLPDNIINGVYQRLNTTSIYLNEYILWGVNIGSIQPSYPSIYAKFTQSGIEFSIWTAYGQYTIVDNSSTIYANNDAFYEFVWDAEPMDDFAMSDFDATMAIRVNGEDTVLGNYPIGSMDLSSSNFCALDSPDNYYNLECTLRRLVLGNEVPTSVEREWHSSSTSSSSSGDRGIYFYDDLLYTDISQEPSMDLVTYTDVDAVNNYLQITTSSRRFKHLWLPNSGNGNTLSKIDITDTNHPVEVGRYKLAVSSDNPSRTVVVPPGDCWVASRSYGTVTKIGLTEASHCRNNCLSTSTGTNELSYGQDDAVLYYFDAKTESMRYPSIAPSSGVAIRGINDDANGNIWVEGGTGGGSRTGTWYKISGDGGLTTGSITKYANLLPSGSYGSVCSYKNNYIWSVKYPVMDGIDYFSADDPNNTIGSLGHVETYGIAYSRGYVYAGDYQSSPDSTTRRVVRMNVDLVGNPDNFPMYTTTFTFTNCPQTLYFPRHFTVLTNNDSLIDSERTEDLYINFMGWGISGYLVVIRNHKQYSDGSNIEIDFQLCEKYQLAYSYTTGVGVMYDVNNKPFVWILNSSNTYVQAFDPSQSKLLTFYNGQTQIALGKTNHYNYTNFTGTVDETSVYPLTGTAIYVIDGVISGRWLKRICLTLDIPTGTSLTISASSSNNSNSFPVAQIITNCADISGLNLKGRYVRVIFQFSRGSQYDPSPTVRDFDVQFV
jgi:hypothetical protein